MVRFLMILNILLAGVIVLGPVGKQMCADSSTFQRPALSSIEGLAQVTEGRVRDMVRADDLALSSPSGVSCVKAFRSENEIIVCLTGSSRGGNLVVKAEGPYKGQWIYLDGIHRSDASVTSEAGGLRVVCPGFKGAVVLRLWR